MGRASEARADSGAPGGGSAPAVDGARGAPPPDHDAIEAVRMHHRSHARGIVPSPDPGALPREQDGEFDGRARHPSGASRTIPALPPILCYHKVDPRLELGVTRISPRRFARQVERLARDGWRTLTLAELLACARGERAFGPRDIAITFDDGYRALRDHAFPVLRAHGYGAVCSIITDYAGRLNRWDVAYGGRRFAHLAWRDIRRWQGQGIEFVSHTATHPRLTWLDDLSVAREMRRSRLTMEQELGEEPEAISYPFGAAREREQRIARLEGYAAGLSLASRWTGDTMSIPRLPVYLWAPPRPGIGLLRHVEWLGAIGANRCAVGTTIIQRLTRRSH